MKIVNIGMLPPPVGGVTVLFREIVVYCREQSDLSSSVVDISSPQDAGFANLYVRLAQIKEIVTQVLDSDVVVLHATLYQAVVLGPLVAAVGKLCEKPWILRKFGGGFADWHREAHPVVRSVVNATTLSADVCLFETKEQVEYFKHIVAGRCEYFGNHRRLPDPELVRNKTETTRLRKLVYIGHIRREKGVEDMITAVGMLPDAVELSLYGPIRKAAVKRSIDRAEGVHYRGLVDYECVPRILREQDLMLFPSLWHGEGQPGVIIEAYGVGLPVIAVRWRGCVDLLGEENELLVEPRSPEEIAEVVKMLGSNRELYQRECERVREVAQEHSVSKWGRKYVSICEDTCRRTSSDAG